MRSPQSYRREIAKLKQIIRDAQWVCPASNSSESCAGCGGYRHLLCYEDCPIAAITGDRGEREVSISSKGSRQNEPDSPV